jgi:hypothetical protein
VIPRSTVLEQIIGSGPVMTIGGKPVMTIGGKPA